MWYLCVFLVVKGRSTFVGHMSRVSMFTRDTEEAGGINVVGLTCWGGKQRGPCSADSRWLTTCRPL